MEIGERIKTIINGLNHNPTSFADVLSVQRSTISHILSGRNKPSLDFIEKLHEKFPEIDIQWLITGDAVKLLKSADKLVESKPISQLELSDEILKIVTFYKDNTFSVYQPKDQL
jgi:transcriptional regulator with XRE-family HTH domain